METIDFLEIGERIQIVLICSMNKHGGYENYFMLSDLPNFQLNLELWKFLELKLSNRYLHNIITYPTNPGLKDTAQHRFDLN